jgi:asparagine synthase (glutamine-hydrolysing)
MHQHVKVAISGDGADELFGSYLSHRLALPLANYPCYLETQDSSLVPGFGNNVDELRKVYAPDDWAWRSNLLTYEEAEKKNLCTEDFRELVGCTSTRAYLREAFADLSSQDPLNRVLEAEFNTILPDQVLTFVDRLSMAHSLEVRCPYLDTAVVEFVASLSGDWKIRNGITKYLLKKAALRYLPREMVERKKEGFLMPISQWLSGELEPYVRETLDRDRIAPLNVFRPDAVECLVNRLYATPNPHYSAVNQVYALVVFFEWADLYLR